MAEQPQPLDAISLIRRKKLGEEPLSPPVQVAIEEEQEPTPPSPLRMKQREMVQLTAVHVRIPEQIARGMRLMAVLEGRQTQDLAAEAFEAKLDKWNPKWRDSVPSKS